MKLDNTNCYAYPDPATASAPSRPSFWLILKTFCFSILIFIGVFIIGGIAGDPAAGAGWGLVALTVFAWYKGRPWREKFLPLLRPVSFSEFDDPVYKATIDSMLSDKLSRTLQNAYFTMLEFCEGDTDVRFTPAEINMFSKELISNNTFSTLVNYGFILRPERGVYCLEPLRAKTTQLRLDTAEANKQQDYDTFCIKCEEHNQQAVSYNQKLLAQRNKK